MLQATALRRNVEDRHHEHLEALVLEVTAVDSGHGAAEELHCVAPIFPILSLLWSEQSF